MLDAKIFEKQKLLYHSTLYTVEVYIFKLFLMIKTFFSRMMGKPNTLQPSTGCEVLRCCWCYLTMRV